MNSRALCSKKRVSHLVGTHRSMTDDGSIAATYPINCMKLVTGHCYGRPAHRFEEAPPDT